MKRENIREQIEYLKDIGIDTTSCFECGNKEDIEYHHIIPYAWGGRRVIPLCGNCHNMVHKGRTRKDNHRELVKAGIEKKKQKAIEMGIEWKWGNDAKHMATPENAANGRKANTSKAREHALLTVALLKSQYEEVSPYRRRGLTLREMVDYLNDRGSTTRRGKSWTTSSLDRVIKYAEGAADRPRTCTES